VRILISGAGGFLGGALCAELRRSGHDIVSLTRGEPAAGAVHWDPSSGELDPAAIEGFGAVFHLAGEGIGDRRWNESHKARVRDSRVQGTTLLARTLGELESPPPVLLSASAIGYYGDRGDELLKESAPVGGGFLARVVEAWEEATRPAQEAGVRVVTMRSGLVLDPSGGVLRRQLIPFRLGLGGRIGSGRQYWSWITLEDEIRAMLHLLQTDLFGPVNLTAPHPVTNAEFTTALAGALSRPGALFVPAAALELVLGKEMADEMLLFSQRVVPKRLEESGFVWRHPDLRGALRALLAKG
jgi:uncharacterized protein